MNKKNVFIVTIDYFNRQLIDWKPSQLFDENDPSAKAYFAMAYNTHLSRIGWKRVVLVLPEIFGNTNFYFEASKGILLDCPQVIQKETNYGNLLKLEETVLSFSFDKYELQSWNVVDFEVRECTSTCRTHRLNGICRNLLSDEFGRIGYSDGITSNGLLLSHEGMLCARTPGSKQPFDVIISNEKAVEFLQRRQKRGLKKIA